MIFALKIVKYILCIDNYIVIMMIYVLFACVHTNLYYRPCVLCSCCGLPNRMNPLVCILLLIGGLPMCVLSYIFSWHRGSSGQPPWVRLLHSLGHCHLARLCKIYSAQRYETVNGLATNVPLHYPELNWSGCLYDLNIGIKNESNKI